MISFNKQRKLRARVMILFRDNDACNLILRMEIKLHVNVLCEQITGEI